jgi:DNA-binding LytR/AlgR family response regulator
MAGRPAVTSGEVRGTSGAAPVTSGVTPFRLWILSAIPLGLVALINTTSVLMEDPPGERDFEAWEPALWEGSSAILLFALVPLVWRWLLRWPIRPPWARAAAIHLLLSVPFSLLHVAGMVAIRQLGYALAGGRYDFFHDGVAVTLLYEWRKDLLSYGLLLLILSVIQRLRQKQVPAAPTEPMLSIRTDGAFIHLKPSEVRLVEAAGNYVEFDVGTRRHLVRMTLSAAAAQLGDGFAQVHRSRLVNLSLVRAERPQPSGDVQLLLADGTTVMASRRYRDRLPSARGLGAVTKAS